WIAPDPVEANVKVVVNKNVNKIKADSLHFKKLFCFILNKNWLIKNLYINSYCWIISFVGINRKYSLNIIIGNVFCEFQKIFKLFLCHILIVLHWRVYTNILTILKLISQLTCAIRTIFFNFIGAIFRESIV